MGAAEFDNLGRYEIWLKKLRFWQTSTGLNKVQQAWKTIRLIRNNHKIKLG